MNRLLSAMKLDVIVQLRTNLYSIGIGAGIIVAIAVSQLGQANQFFSYIPALMLLVAGGSTLLYVAGLLIFEKDEGTLSATIVSPLRPFEYLWSKIITLTTLSTLESVVMIGGAMLIMSFSETVPLPNIPLLLIGIITIAILYTLIGIVLVVRYDKITDFLLPMSGLAMLLQLPFIYFLGWVNGAAWLIIPTSAPTMLMRGAYVPLTTWEWVYAIGYTAVLLIGLTIWAQRAFHNHIVMKVG